MTDDAAPPEARPGEIRLSLAWDLDEHGRLAGAVEAENISDHVVRLSHKPSLRPLGEDGTPLDADHVVTLEGKLPGYVTVQPGERAVAGVSWGGWHGPPASGRVVVHWAGGEAEVVAAGPTQPTATEPTNLSSGWFERID